VEVGKKEKRATYPCCCQSIISFLLRRYNQREVDARALRDLLLWCGTNSIKSVADCIILDGRWKSNKGLGHLVRSSRETRVAQALELFSFLSKRKGAADEPMEKTVK
jgi:hypothetical protein